MRWVSSQIRRESFASTSKCNTRPSGKRTSNDIFGGSSGGTFLTRIVKVLLFLRPDDISGREDVAMPTRHLLQLLAPHQTPRWHLCAAKRCQRHRSDSGWSILI